MDWDERILDIIAALIVGGAIITLAGLIVAPSIFIPVAAVLAVGLCALALT